ncbi:MAG: hypothetical protein ACXAEF_13770 [Candidatus Thorarchaeota archaeon]|jgi:hypothetical protein
MKEMNKRFYIVLVLLSCMLLPGYAEANEQLDFWISPLTSETFVFSCFAGDTLEGEIVITLDGDHYSGDMQKYDLWVGWGSGVDFYIMNQTSYSYWLNNDEVPSYFEKQDVTTLSWSVTIPSDGECYIIYDNDSSVYGKQVEGSITHESQSMNHITTITLLSAVSLISIILLVTYFWKK